jgi:hypothetical protein
LHPYYNASGDANNQTSGMSRSVPSSPGDRKPQSWGESLPIVGSAESLVGRVLRDQGLGKYCDPEFVRAASREMQEAMDMTPEEFDAAAHQLLAAERQGTLRLPVATESGGWGQADESADESVPLRQVGGLPGRFEPAPAAGQPLAPSRRRKGPTGPPNAR